MKIAQHAFYIAGIGIWTLHHQVHKTAQGHQLPHFNHLWKSVSRAAVLLKQKRKKITVMFVLFTYGFFL